MISGQLSIIHERDDSDQYRSAGSLVMVQWLILHYLSFTLYKTWNDDYVAKAAEENKNKVPSTYIDCCTSAVHSSDLNDPLLLYPVIWIDSA